ncbi:MAG: hypothetical protein ABIH83_01020 [Candidatus Micrarchaeota archaeon]
MKKFAFAAIILFLFIFSGCVRIESYEQFYPNGRSRVVSQIYVASLVKTLDISGLPPPEAYANNGGWEAYIEDECNSFSETNPGYMCHRSGDWLIIDNDRVSGSQFILVSYESLPYTMYELTIFQPPLPPVSGFEEVGQFHLPSNTSFSSIDNYTVAQLKAAGLKYNYLVIVPGEITDYNYGKLTEQGVVVDAVAVAEKGEPIRVTSRELKLPHLTMLILGALFLSLFLDFAAIWILMAWAKRKEESTRKRLEQETTEARKRVFRKDETLKDSEVYKAKRG